MIKTREDELVGVETGQDDSQLAICRSRIYKSLSNIYSRPIDRQLWECFQNWCFIWREHEAAIFPESIRRGLGKINTWFAQCGVKTSPEMYKTLESEFIRLFKGLNQHQSPPPPYESVYMDVGILYGSSTRKVAQAYSRFHLKGPDSEPPDHIALELNFMHFLCEKEALAWKAKQNGQSLVEEEATFLAEHLTRWVPMLCRNIRRFDAIGLYEGLADMTEGWIDYDQRISNALSFS